MMCPDPASKAKVHAGLGSQVSSAVRAMWTRENVRLRWGERGVPGPPELFEAPTVLPESHPSGAVC